MKIKNKKQYMKEYRQTEEYKKKKREQDKKYRRTNKGKETIKAYKKSPRRIEMNKQHKRKLHYNLSHEEFKELLEKQKGVCAICKELETEMRNGKIYELCVDHNHDTGETRGLTCRKCNSGLGLFKDDPKLLLEAYSYLENISFEKWLKEEAKDAKRLGLI